MLVAHHIIDCLRGSAHYPFFVLPGVTDEARKGCAAMISRAEKFDFGDLPLEADAQGRPGHWTIPMLTPDEIAFWRDGYIVLPADLVWYEWTLGASRSGLLVRKIDDVTWGVQRLDWTPRMHPLHGQTFESALLFEAIETSINALESNAEELSVRVLGNYELFAHWKEAAERGHDIRSVVHNNITTAPMLALYLTLMLNSKTTEIAQAEPPPPKLNKKRVSAGRAPLAAHRIVTIVPERFRRAAADEAKGTHRPPRLHWRRSHLRHYSNNTPRSRWMPHVVHDGRAGWWVAVIPRMLVGRADLGEVSHEYRIAHDERNGLSGTLQPTGN
jgi:hypothetical protein